MVKVDEAIFYFIITVIGFAIVEASGRVLAAIIYGIVCNLRNR